MYRPPLDPRTVRPNAAPSGRGILVTFAMVATALVVVWVESNPLAGTAVIVAVVGLAVGVRRARDLVHCFFECGGFAVELGGTVRVCIVRPGVEATC
ncbi:MAG: hypothetical protein ACOC8O_03635 [Natronomonas sp.]